MKKQYCLNPNSSNQFLYLRAIQGHSRDNAIDPELQDNVLLPKGFTEYTNDVGDAIEFNSIVRIGLIPGRKSITRGRQAVFFTTVNPMEDRNSTIETPRDFTKPRIAPYKNTWKRNQNTACWCNLKLAQEKGLQFYQTRSHAVVLCNTLPAACIKKAVCMKTKEEPDELNSKMANGLCSKRVRTVVNKIHKAKTQDHLGNHQAI